MEHTLNLASVSNARELGGFAAGGKTVKHGILLRTASLSALSPEDKSILETTYRVATVVDLRMSVERELASDPAISGAENVFLPVLEMEDYPGYDPELVKQFFAPNADRLAMMKMAMELGMLSDRLYVDFLFSERGKIAYRGLFRALLELPEGRAILWHCTDGKDRTGIAAMLILTALGATRQTILKDYLLTNTYNVEKLTAVRTGLEHSPLTPELRELILFGSGAVFERFMTNALDAMDGRCGSPEGYLARELGFGAAECDALRQKYLE